MKLKKVVALVAVGAVATNLVACSSSSGGSATTAAAETNAAAAETKAAGNTAAQQKTEKQKEQGWLYKQLQRKQLPSDRRKTDADRCG